MADVNGDILSKHFAQMGARVKLAATTDREVRYPNGRRVPVGDSRPFVVDLAKDAQGQYFSLRYREDLPIRMQVVDLEADARHLLLLVQNGDEKGKFLCGHDEREWFTCAVPGNGVRDVATAKEALKPPEVRKAQGAAKLTTKELRKRNTKAYLRQGEWFLVPVADAVVGDGPIHYNEPLRRGRSRPHMAQECVRKNGTTVYVSTKHPNGLTQKEYTDHMLSDPTGTARQRWQVMVRDADVYVRGRITQPGGHKALDLPGWHQVFPNTESNAPWAQQVAFLD